MNASEVSLRNGVPGKMVNVVPDEGGKGSWRLKGHELIVLALTSHLLPSPFENDLLYGLQ